MTGQEAYDGLTTYFTFDFTHEPEIMKGVIIEGELPSFPEPPEPPAE